MVNDVRRGAYAPVGKNAVGAGNVQRGRFPRAQIKGRGAGNISVEARQLCGLNDIGQTGAVADAHGHGVAGKDEAEGGRLHAPVRSVRIAGGPVGGSAYFPIGNPVIRNAGIRRIALLEKRGVNERFEQGAGLTPGLNGAVQLGFFRVPAADDGQKSPRGIVHDYGGGLDVVGHRRLRLFLLFRRERLPGGQGGLIFRLGGQLVFQNSPLLPLGLQGGQVLLEILAGFQRVHVLIDGIQRGVLQIKVQCGMHHQSSQADVFFLQNGVQLPAHETHGVIFLRPGLGRPGDDRLRQGRLILHFRNLAFVFQQAKDNIAHFFCFLRMFDGGKIIWAVNNAGQGGAFRQG